jgi:hypothetical protein
MTLADMEAHERRAEAAYAAMYDARRPKDDYEDAMSALGDAIKAAEAAQSSPDAKRLKQRRDHIREVYKRQFRGF